MRQVFRGLAALPPEAHSIAGKVDLLREECAAEGFSTRVWHARYPLGG